MKLQKSSKSGRELKVRAPKVFVHSTKSERRKASTHDIMKSPQILSPSKHPIRGRVTPTPFLVFPLFSYPCKHSLIYFLLSLYR